MRRSNLRPFNYFGILEFPPAIPRIRWPQAARSVPMMLLVSLVLAVLSAPVYPMIYGPNIDDSLHWAFNYFADGHYRLAEQVTFPHGPLAFLLYPLAMGNNFFVALATHLAAAAALAFTVLFTGRARGHLYPGTAAIALLLLLSVCDLQLLLAGLVVSLLTLNRLRTQKSLLPLYVLPAVIAIFVKTYAGLICGLLIAGEIVFRIGRGQFKTAWQTAAVYGLFFVAGWLLLFGDLSLAGQFLFAQVQLALDNSEAVQFHNAYLNWLLIGSMIAGLVITYVMIDEPLGRQYSLLMALPLFAAWKHGMGRAEASHMAGFFHFLVLFVVLLWLLSPQRRPGVILVSLIAPLSFGAQLALYENYDPQSGMRLFKLTALKESIFSYDSLARKKQLEIRHATREQHLPEPLKAVIGTDSVDIYPWNYSIIPVNGLNWRPRPVLNSYASYTPWLDRKDSSWFCSRNAPRFIVWHHTDPNERGYQLESIDNRYLLNDQPLALTSLIAHYERRVNTDRAMLLEKRTRPLLTDRKKVAKTIATEFGAWTEVPQIHEEALLRVRVRMKKTITGALKSLLYKGEIFHIFYELSDGRCLSHRFVPKNAEHGLWLNPLMLRHSVNRGAQVTKIMLRCDDAGMMKPELSLEFERITFSADDKEINVCGFFSDHCIDSTSLAFLNTSTSDYVQHPDYFISTKTKLTTTDFLSPPASYDLSPGDTSGIFVLPLDSLHQPNGRKFRLIVTANVKASPLTDAYMGVYTDAGLSPGSLVFKKPLSEILRGSRQWINCSAFLDVGLIEGPRLYAVIINPEGYGGILLDDMAVSLAPTE